ncbi:MAG: protocatechuate 3,4-dioxygenase subunit alpha [Alphaproteobacteria bacterium]|nr:protocatechuate 3,4-dioxygenase subunit alpha [Alphaproteobacteria bacterium]
MPSATASQTIGPYWHLLEEKDWADLTRFGAQGAKIRVIGTITDGDGEPVSDACVELWQADPPASPDFNGFGRCASDSEGNFHFITVKPGPLPGRGNQQQAPHLAITLMARGLLKALVTRAYFEGETLNETDPLLSAIDDPQRRDTLIARRIDDSTWRLDIRLQGESETVFLEI